MTNEFLCGLYISLCPIEKIAFYQIWAAKKVLTGKSSRELKLLCSVILTVFVRGGALIWKLKSKLAYCPSCSFCTFWKKRCAA